MFTERLRERIASRFDAVAKLIPFSAAPESLLGVDEGRVRVTDPEDDLLSTGEMWFARQAALDQFEIADFDITDEQVAAVRSDRV